MLSKRVPSGFGIAGAFLLTLLVLGWCRGTALAQAPNPVQPCGTAPAPPSVFSYIENLRRDGLLEPIYGTENQVPVIYLPIQVHLLANNNGSGRYPLSTFATILCELNQKFRSTGIQFYWKGNPNLINNSAWYNLPNFGTVDQINTQYNVAGSINVYFLSLSAMSLCGFAYYPGTGSPAQTNRQGAIYMALACSNPGNSTLAHEMGHFLNLPHPFDQTSNNPQATWAERVTRNPNETAPRLPANCATAGDRFCDTPADFRDARWNCPNGGGAAVDINNDAFQPLGRLYMSYANDACQDSFTVEQKAAMRATVTPTGPRSYLLTPPMPVHDSLVGVPRLLQPLDSSYGLPINFLRFRWHAVAGATAYVLRIRWLGTTVEDFWVTDTSFVYNGTGQLLNNRVYRWSVMALNPRAVCGAFASERLLGVAAQAFHLATVEGCSGDSLSLEVLNADFTGLQSLRLKLNLPPGMLRYTGWGSGAPQALGLQVQAYPPVSSQGFTDSLVLTWSQATAVNWTAGVLLRIGLTWPAGVNAPASGLDLVWDTVASRSRVLGSQNQPLSFLCYNGRIYSGGGCYALSGRLIYDNSAGTPLGGTSLVLRDTTLQIRATGTTDSLGYFGWNNAGPWPVIPSWTYAVPWGGVNATDALGISRAFASLVTLSPLRLLAADVNGSGAVNNTDALLANRRSAGLIGSFAGGDWVTDQPGPWAVGLLGIPGTVKALCKGDVNGSYLPSVAP
jgi:hypothetical protein